MKTQKLKLRVKNYSAKELTELSTPQRRELLKRLQNRDKSVMKLPQQQRWHLVQRLLEA
jgi:hypothetical protein